MNLLPNKHPPALARRGLSHFPNDSLPTRRGEKTEVAEMSARYFIGLASQLGQVQALPHQTFAELVEATVASPVQLALTRPEMFALPDEEQNKRKKTDYLVPAVFKSRRSPRKTRQATHCNVLFIDVDDGEESARILSVGPETLLGNLSAVVWHTARSTPEKPRLRVMVPVNGVPVAHYSAAVTALAGLLGMNAVTSESKVAVQPMYLPVQYKDSTASPIAYQKTDGQEFDHTQIASLKGVEPMDLAGGDLGAIANLRPPVDNTTPANAVDTLSKLDPSCCMKEWVETGMALKHQFGEDGYPLWDKWSAKSNKYPGEATTLARWESFKQNPPDRIPITFRSIIRKANLTDSLILPGGEISITESAEEIFLRIAARSDIFFRGGRAHEVVMDTDGSRRLAPFTSVRFRSRLEDYGTLFVWRSGGKGEPVLKHAICPEEIAKALLESSPARDLLPPVSILAACPVLVPTAGQCKVLQPGWSQEGGGIFITGGATPPTLNLPDAVEGLLGLLADFDFTTPGDHSRAIAAFIAPALRFGGWLQNQLPVDIAEADASQAGKGYRQKCTAAIYREVPNLVVQKSGGVGGFDESLSQKLIDGRPFVLIDNLRGKLDSPFFEAVLTAPGTTPARVPHRGEVQVDARSFVFQITSNGMETTRDLANRASIIRIRKRPPGYPFKAYSEGDLFAHLGANQPFYLGCVFAVIKHWVYKGKPTTTESRHDFREWAQKLDWIVQNVFAAVPLLDGFDEARQRVSDPHRSWVRAVTILVHAAGKSGQQLTATHLAEIAADNDLPPPSVKADACEVVMAQAIGRTMGSTFGNTDEVEIDGYTVRRILTPGLNGKNNKTYVFPTVAQQVI